MQWQVSAIAIQAIFSLTSLAVFGRLISQDAFGQFAIINVLMLFIVSFTEFGFGACIVQLKEYNKFHIHFAFYASLILGVVTFGIMCLFAGWISHFYDDKIPLICIQVISVNLIIKSLGVVSNALMIRRFQFKQLFISVLVSNIIGTLGLGIYLALNGYEVWALIFALLSVGLIQVILNFFFAPHSVLPIFSKKETKEVVEYGTGLTSVRVISQIANSMDKLIIGKYFPMASLGLYEQAFKIANLPKVYIARSIDGVLFSIMSRVQDNFDKQRSLYLNSLSLVGIITASFAMTLLFFPSQVIEVLLGNNWLEAAPLLQIFGAYSFCVIYIRFTDTLVRAQNKLWGSTVIKIIFAFIKVILIILFIKTNLFWLAAVATLAYFIHAILMLWYASKIVEIKLVAILKAIKPVVWLTIFICFKNVLLWSLDIHQIHAFIFLLFIFILDAAIILSCYIKRPEVFGKDLFGFIKETTKEIPFIDQFQKKLDPYMKWSE